MVPRDYAPAALVPSTILRVWVAVLCYLKLLNFTHHAWPVRVMPEIPYAYDHVTPSETHTNQTAGATISPVHVHGHLHRLPASDDAARRTLDYDQTTGYAYQANPNSDSVFRNTLYPSSSANDTHDAVTPTGAPYRLSSAAPTNAAVLPDLSLANFGSQPWPATSAPYLEFAQQPVYEPTGELVHEAVQQFRHFDDPSSFGQPTWRSEEETIASLHQPPPNASNSALPSPTVHKDAQNFPKPALKRPLDSESGPDPVQPGGYQSRPPPSDPRKFRRVSFERMSGTGPVSADDEESSSSEATSSAVRATPQAAFRGLPRRGRGSRGSGSSSGPAQRPGPQQGTNVRALNPTGKGSKTPTGHPPSILPPEKVFPIQIGSELFRLSGASISSDGQL